MMGTTSPAAQLRSHQRFVCACNTLYSLRTLIASSVVLTGPVRRESWCAYGSHGAHAWRLRG
jgi:hypothetical protein